MDLSVNERKEIVSTTLERLSLVIGASGNAEELVSLVTQIVKALKKLIEDVPEATKTRGTSILAEFVFAAKKIAKDARAVDSALLQQLSSTKRAVESLVKEVNSFYESQQISNNDVELESLLRQTSVPPKPADQVNGMGRTSPSKAPPTTDSERRLTVNLKQQQQNLQRKSEPQENPVQHGQPTDVLQTAMAGLDRATMALVEASGRRSPDRASVLEPTLLLARMVSMLIDLVDSLFVSKYPMRAQVHSFCCMLIDNALLYGEQSMTDDAASLRLISTQAPALMSALEVMAEQCYKRSENIRESQKMSIQRGVDLHDLDQNKPGLAKSIAAKKRKEPPVPRTKKDQVLTPPPPLEFEIGCMICTSVAVDSESKEILTKGSEIKLCVNEKTQVGDIRKMLTKRTGLPLADIQIRFRGDDVLLDEVKVTPNNPIPYFMFNMHEPGEEELQDFKKQHRRKQRIRIDNADWSKVSSPIAVALYDYESLGDGEDDSLEFEEGELIEIVEKSGDGWWTARIDGQVGVIPASFVEEIVVPQSKDEAKRLVKRFKQGRLGSDSHAEAKTETTAFEDESRSVTSSPSPSSAPSHKPLAGVGKALRRIHSGGSHDYSKLSSKKNSDSALKEKKEKKRSSLFKKRTTSHDPIMEYKEVCPPSASQGSPILSSPSNRKLPSSILEYDQQPQTSPRMAVKRLSRPASSPRLVRTMEKPPLAEKLSGPSTAPLTSQSFEKPQSGETSLKLKRRPPPPPPPYQKTYPRRAADEVDSDPIIMKVIPPEDEPKTEDPLVKSSSSMEDLLRNLEEFDELASPSLLNEGLLADQGPRDFATIPRNELPPKFDSSDSSPDLQNRHTIGSSAPQKPPRKRSKKKPEPPSEPPLPPPTSPRQGQLETSPQSQVEANTGSSEGRESPIPQAPPRRKSRKGTSERKEAASPILPLKPSQSPLLSSRNSPIVPPKPGKAPLPPPKPVGLAKPIPGYRISLEKSVCSSAPVSRTVSPEDGRLSASARETSVSTDLLTSSPVVMRRTNAVNASLDPDFSDEELEDCTGIGKEGVLHKEGVKKVEWKSRYFKLTSNTVDYFDGVMAVDNTPPLGQISVSRMQGAVPLGEKDGFQCFAINMKYDTSVVLGCHSRADLNDWVKSINKMIKGAKSGEMIETYLCAYNAAVKCIEYLSFHVVEDRALIAAAVPSSRVNRWLEAVDKGQEPDIRKMPDATTAACFLRSLFGKGRLGCLVKYEMSKELVELTQSANPISILSTKLSKLSSENRNLFKQLLRLFAKVLEYSHKNGTELEDLNRTFGPLVFERMGAPQTEPLFAYLISTCELIIS